MSHFSIVRDASLALRDLLFGALNTVPDVDFGFSNVTTDIVLSAPDSDIPENARLSVYLYNIAPDPEMRNQRDLAVGPGGLIRPPLPLRLHYLITPLQGDEAQNQLVLGRVMQALHDTPFLGQVGGAPLDDSFGGGSPELRLSIVPMTLEELSRIWHAMGTDYRLSVTYMMRVAMIDTALDPRRAARVAEKHLVVETRD